MQPFFYELLHVDLEFTRSQLLDPPSVEGGSLFFFLEFDVFAELIRLLQLSAILW